MRGVYWLTGLLLATGCQQLFGLDTPSLIVDAGLDGVADDASDAGVPELSCALVLGSDHSCVWQRAPQLVSCVGSNQFGELGRGTSGTSSVVLQPVGLAGVEEVASRSYHTCARQTSGNTVCWGYNDRGQLGDATMTTRPSPVDVMSLGAATQLAVGRGVSCATLVTGKVVCWGDNNTGAFGDGTMTSSSVPMNSVQLAETPTQIAVANYGCARLPDATVRCWGANTYGQLGDGTQTLRTSPVMPPVTAVARVAVSSYSTTASAGAQTCVLRTNGNVQCWGSNEFGQLAIGAASAVELTPQDTLLTAPIAELAMGRAHACARSAQGEVLCWGNNEFGQVGDGTMTHRAAPALVLLPRPAVHIAAGGFHTCALLDNDTVRCWGLNASGQLGDNTTTSRTSPVLSMLCQ